MIIKALIKLNRTPECYCRPIAHKARITIFLPCSLLLFLSKLTMSDSHKCGSSKRQLPSSPSCQCHALLSYKVRPQPVYRPDAPEESLKELVDDIFRMGTAYLIRSGERIPSAEMAYFECLNEMGVSECVAPPQLERDQLFGPTTGVQSGCARTKASRAWTSLEDVISLDTIYEVEKQLQRGELGSAEARKPESNPDTELASPTVEKDDPSPTAKKNTCDTVQKPSGPVARYITQDQLGTMGWKDLFKLARVSGHRRIPWSI
jgi:hypothetical protein